MSLVLGFGARLAWAQVVARSPIGALPSGWVCLPSEGIDTWAVTLHDSVSGACLSMEAAWPTVVSPVPAVGAEVGEAKGIRYHLKYGAAWRCKGKKAVSFSFFPPDKQQPPLIWHFSADLCLPEQEPRIRELLLREATIGILPAEQEQRSSKRVARSDVQALVPGASISAVVAKLGVPGDSSCGSRGFEITYAVAKGNSYREWDLRFDSQQRFVSAKQRFPD